LIFFFNYQIMKKGQFLFMAALFSFFNAFSQDNTKTFNDYILSRTYDNTGKEIVTIVVPGTPPLKHREPIALPTRSSVILNNVPAFDWSFGCSATSAAMAAGYYDNNGYPNMYAGPSNYGFAPMDNSIWGTVVINGETRAQCPLSASRNTVDGRTTRGHVDDYWIQTNNAGPDPFIVNGWTEHTYGGCTGDYMKTNQSTYNNIDGGTTFAFYTNGSPLSVTDPWEGSYGLKLFYESRGYTVLSYFSQYIYGWSGNTLGFTFNQYKNEINNGRPVIIQVEGHSMLGYGYDDATSTVYLHDTWDYSSHTMTWGGDYAGMLHYGVCVVQLAPSSENIVANFSASARRQLINTTVTLNDNSWGNPNAWNWSISPSTFIFTGGTSATSQNPQVQFTDAGLYKVTLSVSKTGGSDTETKTNFIEAVNCSTFPLPLTEDFSEQALPLCWLNVDNIGTGQVWQFDNPGDWGINTSTAANGFAILDSDTYGGSGSQNADLVTPLLDFTGYTSVNLSFEHFFRQYSTSTGTVMYSIDGGNNWTAIQSWTANTANAETFSQNLSAQLAGQSNVKIKWNYVGAYDYYWAVDDISITGVRPGLWTGTSSGSWNTASNWSGSAIPTGTTNVTIPFISPNWPVYNGDLTIGTNCGNITLENNAHLTITGELNVPTGKQVILEGNAVMEVEGVAK
jgi:PKD repeat protein